ncbi:MAG: arginase [Acidobacteria bacterium]|nr:MAG: arginase [Acidobacteriota bacterium]
MSAKTINVIGVPLDLGAGRRGVDMGPSAMRVADLNKKLATLGYSVEDAGNVPVTIPETQHFGDQQSKFLKEIIQVCEHLAQLVEKALDEKSLPIVLGGDHSIAIGTLGGGARFYQRIRQNIGLIWFDAHADFNTPETSPSGNVHGMPLSAVVGVGPQDLTNLHGICPKVKPQNAVLVGVRDIDVPEKELLVSSAVRVFTMRDIDERGMRSVVEEAIKIATQHTAGLAVSWDMDFLDPSYAPGVGTPVKGGASYREAHLAMEMIADTNKLLSLELVEVNPVLDHMNTTASLGVELILSALGKKIL